VSRERISRHIDVVVVMQAAVSVQGRVRIARDGQSVDAQCLQSACNPVDLVALEEALKLRETGLVSTVTCLAAGSGADAVLAHGIAMGADRIVRIHADEDLYVDARVLGRSIAAALAGSPAQLLFVAGQSADGEADAIPHEIAAALRAACLTNVTALRLANGEVEVERWLEKGRREIWAARLPAVVAFNVRANTPRYVTVAALALARRTAASAPHTGEEPSDAAAESGAATALQRLVVPRIRVKRVAGSTSRQPASERMRTLLNGVGGEVKSGKPLSGPPDHVADLIVAFLDERGLLRADRKR
jgi:electron transfer flavoprotein beta subunit